MISQTFKVLAWQLIALLLLTICPFLITDATTVEPRYSAIGGIIGASIISAIGFATARSIQLGTAILLLGSPLFAAIGFRLALPWSAPYDPDGVGFHTISALVPLSCWLTACLTFAALNHFWKLSNNLGTGASFKLPSLHRFSLLELMVAITGFAVAFALLKPFVEVLERPDVYWRLPFIGTAALIQSLWIIGAIAILLPTFYACIRPEGLAPPWRAAAWIWTATIPGAAGAILFFASPELRPLGATAVSAWVYVAVTGLLATLFGVRFLPNEPAQTSQASPPDGNGHGQDEQDGQEPDRSCKSCQ